MQSIFLARAKTFQVNIGRRERISWKNCLFFTPA